MCIFKSLLGNHMEEFIDFRCSQGYLRDTYLSTLRSLDEFCASNYSQEGNLTNSIVMDWLDFKPELNVSYLYNRCSVVRRFARFMKDKGFDAYVLPDKFISNRRMAAAYIFTDSELNKLFSAIDKVHVSANNPFAEYQLPVLFRLIYTCGLRPNEGRTLICSNVNAETGEVLITNTKKNRDRIVVMSDDMLELYRKYDLLRNTTYPDSIYAFPNINCEAYTSNWLGRQFTKCWIEANPQCQKHELPRVRIYDLRHRFASAVLHRWLNEKRSFGVMLSYLQAYMGHCELSSTSKYVHMLPENLISAEGVDWDSMSCLIPEVEE